MRRTANDKMVKQIGGMAPRRALLYINQKTVVSPHTSPPHCAEKSGKSPRLKPIQALCCYGRCRSELPTNGIVVEKRLAVECATRLFHHDR